MECHANSLLGPGQGSDDICPIKFIHFQAQIRLQYTINFGKLWKSGSWWDPLKYTPTAGYYLSQKIPMSQFLGVKLFFNEKQPQINYSLVSKFGRRIWLGAILLDSMVKANALRSSSPFETLKKEKMECTWNKIWHKEFQDNLSFLCHSMLNFHLNFF